jgi:hypothetical protein
MHALRKLSRSRFALLPLLVLSAFLPYLDKEAGIRVENLLGAVLGSWAGAVILYSGRLNRSVFVLQAVTLGSLLLAVCITVLAGGAGEVKVSVGRIDHYLRPLSVVSIAGITVGRCAPEERDRVFLWCARILLFGLVCNTVVQVTSLFLDIEPFVGPFRPAPGGGLEHSVAEAAAQNGRLVGIFNQPLEHGAAYAAGLLVWIELWRRRALGTIPEVVGGTAILIGGVLGFSKVFLLGGIPFGMILFFSNGVRLRDLGRLAFALVTVVPTLSFSIANWRGAEGLALFFGSVLSSNTVVYAVSGGRLGVASSLGEEYLISRVMVAFRSSPITGIGLGAAQGLGDNEYLLSLAEGGLLLLTFIFLRQALVILPALPRIMHDPEARLLLGLGGVLVLGGMGGPVSGIPRCGTLLWVFISLMMLSVTDRSGTLRVRPLVGKVLST